MSDVIIRAENLSKRYRIGERQTRQTLRDAIANVVSAPARLLRARRSTSVNGDLTHIWALRDVSFEIQQGEVVGIIGRNGAGKSTLLKILSRVTKPTHGGADVRGRMGSLLEVGTGFHPELTGRENTYLNGAILGMTKREVARKFDEIVAFAEIEKFIDTPVKHYSSGMYLRLAFSVAAHLETEILIVDEVLAVGDAGFQKKCLGKIGTAASQGRTVIFVSHNLGAVQQLTQRCLLLEGGKIVENGVPEQVIARFIEIAMGASAGAPDVSAAPRPFPELSRSVEFLALEIEDCPSSILPAEGDITLKITVRGNEVIGDFRFGLTVYRRDGTPVGSAWTSTVLSIDKGAVELFRVTLPEPRLAPGHYHFALGISQRKDSVTYDALDVILDILPFEVLSHPDLGRPRAKWVQGWGSVQFNELTAMRSE